MGYRAHPGQALFPPFLPNRQNLRAAPYLPIYMRILHMYVVLVRCIHSFPGELSLTDLSPASPAKTPAPQITSAQTPRPAAVRAGPRSNPCSNRRNTKTSAAS